MLDGCIEVIMVCSETFSSTYRHHMRRRAVAERTAAVMIVVVDALYSFADSLQVTCNLSNAVVCSGSLDTACMADCCTGTTADPRQG